MFRQNLNRYTQSSFSSSLRLLSFNLLNLIMVAVVESNSNESSSSSAHIIKGSITTSSRPNNNYISTTTTTSEPHISCTTFNILAPIYKRLDQKNQSVRESDFRTYWLTRNERILDWLLYERSSIICLQEFWVGNNELVRMYEDTLADAGYLTFKLARTNNRGDGLLTAVHKDYFRVLNHQELLFNDFGDRVALLLHVQAVLPCSENMKGSTEQEMLIVNTHLLFPHNSCLSLIRMQQAHKILQYVESYQKENEGRDLPVILCGDWNGSKRGRVYKFLRSQGFVSSYDTAHHYTDSDTDAHKWVSHRNHRGNICGVDFIWLRNPNKARKPLKISWAEGIFGTIKCHLSEASLGEKDAFAFLKGDNVNDFITLADFCDALRQLNLYGVCNGLSFEEVKDLWSQVDIDGDGVINYQEFKRIWNCSCSKQTEENYEDGEETESGTEEEKTGFEVKNAYLFPCEAEKGMWPENYSLSDHARLTAVFSPVRMQCTQPVL